ncbi:MAG: NUDIX domain-containing protein [Betaproteobacteria bacterium]
MNEIDKLAWLRIADRKLLGARSHGKQTWYLPGGKRDPGESDEEALIREIREELCIDLLPQTIVFEGVFRAQADGKPEGTIVKVTCYAADYYGEIRAAAEIEEVAWLTYADRDKCSRAAVLILDWLKSAGRID